MTRSAPAAAPISGSRCASRVITRRSCQAIQKSTQRKVAVKVVHGGPFAGPRERARVEREVRILAGLDHPNIVKIHDSGEIAGVPGGSGSSAGGTFYYVMDYVSGQSLDALISKDPKPISDILKLGPGAVVELDRAAWHRRWQRLQELGGSPLEDRDRHDP